MTRPAVFALPPRRLVGIVPVGADRLATVNGIIERAVTGWALPERVKRLALPLYRYDAVDLIHLTVVAAEDGEGRVLGVAAWEPAPGRELPADARGLLLHGLYVDPPWQRQGVGTALLAAAREAACAGGYDGLLIRAAPGAAGFFARRGCEELPVCHPARDHPHRFWCPVP